MSSTLAIYASPRLCTLIVFVFHGQLIVILLRHSLLNWTINDLLIQARKIP